jgi:hypothetical protein
MLPRKLKARVAESHALKLRAQQGIAVNNPGNPYDIATRLGIDVRFLDLPSVEGVYLPHANAQILISSLRPAGRQSFTCAHELGHHLLEHGEKIDELIESRRSERINDIDEYQADTFASFLLMPRAAVLHAFSARSWRIESALPEQFYQVAQWLGVGYSTLIGHVSRQLKLLAWSRADELMGKSLKSIRASLLGQAATTGSVFLIDHHWSNRSVDCETGDVLLLPKDAQSSGITISLSNRRLGSVMAFAAEPGIAEVHLGDNQPSLRVRVSRKGYVGRYRFRYLEETPLAE